MTRTVPFPAAIAALVALSPGAPLLAVTVADDALSTVEETSLEFSLAELTANDPDDPEAEVSSVSRPVYGNLSCLGELCLYQPPPGWSGTDRFTYTVGDDPASSATATVRVQVAPLVQPVAGDWDGDGTTDLGWFHGQYLDFLSFDLTDVTLSSGKGGTAVRCDHPQVPVGRSGWIPIAGDWEGDARSEIGLFYPPTREFLLFRWDSWAGTWQPTKLFQHPTPGEGGFPVVGNWDGVGHDEVGLFVPEDHRFFLLSSNDPGAAILEVTLTDLSDEPWLPVAGDWGGDGSGVDVVGAWSPERRVLRLRPDNSTGPTYEPDDYSEEGPGLLPVSGSWLGHPVSIGFYDPGGGVLPPLFVLYPCDFDPECGQLGGRQPILLPPPEDPISTSCTAGSV